MSGWQLFQKTQANFLQKLSNKKAKMSRKNNKSSKSMGLVAALGVVIGAGLGYLASKIFQQEPENKKKSEVPANVQKQQKIKITKTNIDSYDDLEELMICPITHEIMTQPCILTTCGHSFEKKFIIDWVKTKQTCPLCMKKASPSDIQVNYQLKELIHYYQNNKNGTKKETTNKLPSQKGL